MRVFPKIKSLIKVSGIFLERLELILAFFMSLIFVFFFPSIGEIEFDQSIYIYYSIAFLIIFIGTFLFKKIKNNAKLIIEYLYGFAVLFFLDIAFKNGFNTDCFFTFLILFAYISVAYRNINSYLIINLFVVLFFISEFLFFKYEIELSRLSIFLSYVITFVIGYLITQVRFIVRSKLEDRQNFLNHLFNSSSQGLILVNCKTKKLTELNRTAQKILGFSNQFKKKELNILDIKIGDENLFTELADNYSKTFELADKRVISIKSELIKYKKQDYYFITLDQYKNFIDLSKSSEYLKLKDISEETYYYLFEENTSLLAIFNKENIFIDLNNTLAKLLEYEKNELIGNSIDLVTHKETDKRNQINEKILNGETVTYEKSIISKSGKIIHVEIISRLGMFLGQEVIISNSRNINERKRLEQESYSNYERYKTVTEESAIGFAVSNIEGEILDSNNSFCKLLGYSLEELRNLKLSDLSHEDDFENNVEIRKKLIEKKIKTGELEKRYYTKDGSVVYVLLKIILQREKDATPKYFFEQIVDITAIREAQKELETSENSYKQLFDNSHEMLYILNRNNEFIDVNKKVIETYDYSKDEIIGQTPVLLAATDKNDLEKIVNLLNLVWEGQSFSSLWWAKTKDGRIFPKQLSVRLGIYNGDEVLIASGIDISESYEYEKKLKEQERRYRELFERNLAGVYRTSLDGKILECNAAFLNILEYPKEDYKKISAYNLHPKKEDRDELVKKIQLNTHLKGEKINLLSKTGKLISVILNASVIKDSEGNLKYYEGSIIDITEQDKIQRKLEKSEKEYKELINSSSFGIVITRKAKILFVNQRATNILGYEETNELFGKNNLDILLKEEIGLYEKQIEDLKNGISVPFMNYSVRKKDGSLVDVECKPSLIQFEGKKSVLLSFIDISDKKKIEAATEKIKATEKFNLILESQLKEKEILLKEVHHRVKNNMQIISSILNLQSSYISNPELTTIIMDSQNRINSMALIHEKLYNTSDFSNIYFDNYIRDLSRSLVNSYNYDNKDIKLKLDLEKIQLSLNNAIPLGLILNELISNSLKYAFKDKEKGKLNINFSCANDEIKLVFQDNGTGLPIDIDFKNTQTLGLQLVNTLVDQLRGEISLNNEKGVCFSIKFNRFE